MIARIRAWLTYHRLMRKVRADARLERECQELAEAYVVRMTELLMGKFP